MRISAASIGSEHSRSHRRTARRTLTSFVVALLGTALVVVPVSPASAQEYDATWVGRGIQYNFDWCDLGGEEPELCGPSHALWFGNFTAAGLGKMQVRALVPFDPATEEDATIRVSGAGGALTAEFSHYWEGTGNGAVYSSVTGTGRFRGVSIDSTISIARDFDFDWPTEPTKTWSTPGTGPMVLDLVYVD